MPDADWLVRIGIVAGPMLLFGLAMIVWQTIANRDDERDLPPAE